MLFDVFMLEYIGGGSAEEANRVFKEERSYVDGEWKIVMDYVNKNNLNFDAIEDELDCDGDDFITKLINKTVIGNKPTDAAPSRHINH